MKIQKISAQAVSVPLDSTYWVSNEIIDRCSLIVVQVQTDSGLVGYGTLHGRSVPEVLAIIDELDAYLHGDDALAHEAVWQKVFGLTTMSPGTAHDTQAPRLFHATRRVALLAAMAGIDIALWDIKGKAVDMPVWRLLGGSRTSVQAYVTGGYYQMGKDPFSIAEEMAEHVAAGYGAVKIKVGGVDLALDVERVKRVREAIGPRTKLMVDANCAYTLSQAIEAIRGFEPYDIHWFEEPLHWYDSVRALGSLARQTQVPIASGESEQHAWGCRDLIDLGGVRFMEFDATRSGGVTEWLRVAAYAQLHGVWMATHHDPHIHGHLAAAAPNGLWIEVFPDARRDPLWAHLFSERAQLRDGHLHLSDKPGFGFEIDWNVVAQYRLA